MLHKILRVHEFICKVCEVCTFVSTAMHTTYGLLLKTICNIRSANSTMDLYIYNAYFDG